MSRFANYLVGIVNVPLSQLTFLPTAVSGRQEDSKNVVRLTKIFDETKWAPSNPCHQIFGLITPKVLKNVLGSLHMSRAELLRTVFATNFELIGGGPEILCLEGRHRVQAAKNLFGEDTWWTVKLHCVPDGKERDAVIQYHCRTFTHEARFFDGDIYYNYRDYLAKNDDFSAREWRALLTDCKAAALDHLLHRATMTDALDRVMLFPGQRGGLQLGNIDKHLATHCDEMIISYLDHVCNVWSAIVSGDAGVMLLVDLDTVRLLQFLAPSASHADRVFISHAMDSGLLFRGVCDAGIRERLKQNLLSLPIVIPSIETFHENMKYITIGADIIKLHLDVKLKKSDPAARSRKRKTTLFERFKSHWTASGPSLMEISEGLFQPLIGPPSPNLAYVVLLNSVLREFFLLSGVSPLRDIRWEGNTAYLDSNYLIRLFRRAHILGFYNEKIRNGLQGPVAGTVGKGIDVPFKVPIVDWRGGKPYTRTALELLGKSFLPTLYRNNDISLDHPTAEYIQNDLINAFCGKFDFELDFSKPTISIVESIGRPRMAPQGLVASDSALQAVRNRRKEVLETLETAKTHAERKAHLLPDSRKRISRVQLKHKVPQRPSVRPDAGPPLGQPDNVPDSGICGSTADTNGQPQPHASILSAHDLDLSPEVPGLPIQSRDHPRPLLQPPVTAAMSDFDTEAATEPPPPIQPMPPEAVAQPTPETDFPPTSSSAALLPFTEGNVTATAVRPLTTPLAVIENAGLQIPDRDDTRPVLRPPEAVQLPADLPSNPSLDTLQSNQSADADAPVEGYGPFGNSRGTKRRAQVMGSRVDYIQPYKKRVLWTEDLNTAMDWTERQELMLSESEWREAERRRAILRALNRDRVRGDVRGRDVARRQAEREDDIRQTFVTIPLNSPEGSRSRQPSGAGYMPRTPIFPTRRSLQM